MPRSVPRWVRASPFDVAATILLFLISAALSWLHSGMLPEALFLHRHNDSIYFEADLNRVYMCVTERDHQHHRANLHPLFTLVAHAAYTAVNDITGLTHSPAVRLVVALHAGLWVSGLFVMLRLITRERALALALTTLALASSAFIFWGCVPETFPAGSVTILVAIAFLAVAERRRMPDWAFAVVSFVTLWHTITNWMVGILATLAHRKPLKAGLITFGAFLLLLAFWMLQKAWIPAVDFPAPHGQEFRFMLVDELTGGPNHMAIGTWLSGIVLPKPRSIPRYQQYGQQLGVISVQQQPPGSASWAGAIGVGTWLALIALGWWAFFAVKDYEKLRAVVGLALVAQTGMHMLYGDEAFLYTPHFLPLQLALVSLLALSRCRTVAIALVLVLTVCCALNNAPLFAELAHTLNARTDLR